MMKSPKSSESLFRTVAAEFYKLYDFRVPQIGYICVTAFLLLFVAQLFYFEHLATHLGNVTSIEVIPYLFFASWKSVLFQLFIISFSCYFIAIDSQYGMIRIGCTQPISRTQYLLGKAMAIELHVALLAIAYVISVTIWSCICTGFRGWSLAWLPALASLTGRTVIFCVGLSGCMVAVSSLRRTLLGALISSCAVFAILGLLTMLPSHLHLGAAMLLRYFFYPIAGILPPGWPIPLPMQDAPLWRFVLASLVTPTVFLVPALVHFHFRDITE